MTGLGSEQDIKYEKILKEEILWTICQYIFQYVNSLYFSLIMFR